MSKTGKVCQGKSGAWAGATKEKTTQIQNFELAETEQCKARQSKTEKSTDKARQSDKK